MMKKYPKSITAPYAVMQMLFWSALCMGQTYAIPFLCDMGLTDGQIGVILAIVNSVVLPASIAVDKLYGRMAHGSVKRLIGLSGVSLIVSLLIMYTAFGQGMLYVTVAFSLVMIFMVHINGLINALGMLYEPMGIRLNFAAGRGMGSLGYALTALCTGRLLLHMETRRVMLLSAVTAGLMLTLLFLFPQTAHQKETVSKQDLSPENRKKTVWSPAFLFLLIACTLLLVSSNTFTNFLLQITVSIGKNEADMGRFAALAAILEVPAILTITALKRHFSDGQLMRFCSAMFIVKYGFIFCLQNTAGMYLAQLMQPFSYAMLLPVSSYYVNTILAPQYAVTGQILLVSTNTVANVAGSLMGGMILQRGSVHQLLGMIVGFAVVGSVVLWLTTTRTVKKTGCI